MLVAGHSWPTVRSEDSGTKVRPACLVHPEFLSAIVCAPSLVMLRGNRDLRHPGLVSCRADVDDFQDHPVWGQRLPADVHVLGPAGSEIGSRGLYTPSTEQLAA